MGDDITEYSIRSIKEAKYPLVLGYDVDDLSEYGALIIDDKMNVTEIKEKTVEGGGLANTGVYAMHKTFFDVYDHIPKNEKNGEYYLTDAIKILNDSGVRFFCRKADFWLGVNTPEQLKAAREKI